MYRTYDGRLVSSRVIKRVIRDLDAKQRRYQMLRDLRVWGAVALVGIILLILTVGFVVSHVGIHLV